MTIFVSIASYRDPELVPTVRDCLAKARWPDQLRFGICWQHGEEEDVQGLFKDDPKFRVLDVPWRQSRGACWARAEIMGFWNGEDHFLQIDSHHRFVQGWDAKLIEHAEATSSPKPIMTTYCPMYIPGDEEFRPQEPTQIDFDYFTDDGIALFKPAGLLGWPALRRAVRARFVSGHFLFAPGSFVQEVPYNPDMYFHGEEITIALRAFTWGYDLFHPPEVILWHEYSRAYRRKHWDDHVEAEQVEQAWYQRDDASRRLVRGLLSDSHHGDFGCGSVRTIADYEAYAGISFAHRKVQDYTRKGGEPPNPRAPGDWADRIHDWRVHIELHRNRVPEAALTDPQFWYVGIHDAEGTELYRNDLCDDELKNVVTATSEHIVVERSFQSSETPVSWTVWPVTRTLGWLDQITGPVATARVHSTHSPGGPHSRA